MVDLTVIVPAYNEETCVGDTIVSIQQQTIKPKNHTGRPMTRLK